MVTPAHVHTGVDGASSADPTSTVGVPVPVKRANSCSDLGALLSKMEQFRLEPIAGPLVTTYTSGTYVYTINPQQQITKMCCLYRITKHRPAFM